MDQPTFSSPSEPQPTLPSDSSPYKNPKFWGVVLISAVLIIGVFYLAMPYLPPGILRLFPMVILEHEANKEVKKAYPKTQAVHLITSTQFLGKDLQNYHREKGKYPLNLEVFLDDTSYANRSFITAKSDAKQYGYAVSPDAQNFVIYTSLLISKDEVGKVNGFPINAIGGNILGINCSDVKIFCFSNLSN